LIILIILVVKGNCGRALLSISDVGVSLWAWGALVGRGRLASSSGILPLIGTGGIIPYYIGVVLLTAIPTTRSACVVSNFAWSTIVVPAKTNAIPMVASFGSIGAARPIGATARRIGATARPIGATARPIGATARPIGGGSTTRGSLRWRLRVPVV